MASSSMTTFWWRLWDSNRGKWSPESRMFSFLSSVALIPRKARRYRRRRAIQKVMENGTICRCSLNVLNLVQELVPTTFFTDCLKTSYKEICCSHKLKAFWATSGQRSYLTWTVQQSCSTHILTMLNIVSLLAENGSFFSNLSLLRTKSYKHLSSLFRSCWKVLVQLLFTSQ